MEYKVEIDPNTFRNLLEPAMEGEHIGERIFGEGDVIRFLIDRMNQAGLKVSMIRQDHETGIEYRGRQEYISLGVASLDTPEQAVVEGICELSYVLNDFEGVESYVSYLDGKHFLHLKEAVKEP